MRIEPAHIDQIRRARSGRMVLISADAGGVAADLRRIDPHLKVRFAEAAAPPCWIVFWESDDARDTYIVTSATAYQNAAGVWEGLDQRIVKRIEEIDPHGRSGYDYARELEKHNEQVKQAGRERFRAAMSGTAEEAAWAVRKDTGSKLKAFVPRDVPA